MSQQSGVNINIGAGGTFENSGNISGRDQIVYAQPNKAPAREKETSAKSRPTQPVWNNQLRKQFHALLLKAYNRDALTMMLAFELDKEFETLVKEDNFQVQVFALIKSAERGNWILDLVHAAHKANPNHQSLAQFAAQFQSSDGHQPSVDGE